jgi:hypothetical protein
MFEDLNWKSAARRSAVVIAIYLGLLYLLSVAFPGSGFSMDSRAQVISLFVNAIIFFFIFTFVYALVERSRNRRIAEARKQKKPAKQATGEATRRATPRRSEVVPIPIRAARRPDADANPWTSARPWTPHLTLSGSSTSSPSSPSPANWKEARTTTWTPWITSSR